MSPNQPEENKPLDFSNTNDLLKIDNELFTIEQWHEIKEDMGLFASGYASGQQSMVKILIHLLELKLPFDELNKQLTGFVTERNAFTKHANVP